MRKLCAFVFVCLLISCAGSSGKFGEGNYVATFSRGEDVNDETGFWPLFNATEVHVFKFGQNTFSILNFDDVEVLKGNWGFRDGESSINMTYSYEGASFDENYALKFDEDNGNNPGYFVLTNAANGFVLNLYPEEK